MRERERETHVSKTVHREKIRARAPRHTVFGGRREIYRTWNKHPNARHQKGNCYQLWVQIIVDSNLLWNLYLQSSAATMSISRMYLDFLSRPETRTLKAGNMRLKTYWGYVSVIEITCCGICIGSRPPPLCPTGVCILLLSPDRTRGISFGGTFA